jgi:hypothetical protein
VAEALATHSANWKEHAVKEPPPPVFSHTYALYLFIHELVLLNSSINSANVIGDEMWVFGGRYEDDSPTKSFSFPG